MFLIVVRCILLRQGSTAKAKWEPVFESTTESQNGPDYRGGWANLLENVPTATPADLSGMFEDIVHYLSVSEMLHGVEVEQSNDIYQTLVAHCKTAFSVTAPELYRELEHLWTQHLAYRYFEAHEIFIRDETLVLEGVTMVSASRYYMCIRLLVTTDH